MEGVIYLSLLWLCNYISTCFIRSLRHKSYKLTTNKMLWGNVTISFLLFPLLQTSLLLLSRKFEDFFPVSNLSCLDLKRVNLDTLIPPYNLLEPWMPPQGGRRLTKAVKISPTVCLGDRGETRREKEMSSPSQSSLCSLI